MNKQWYVVYTKPQKEEFAQSNLKLKGIDPFLPRLLLPNFARKRKRIVPLFPNYLFVRIDVATDACSVVWSPGVKYLIGAGGNPLPVEDKIIDYLKRRANREGIITARSNLRAGQRVQVCAGPFEGLEAIIQNPPDAKGRVLVLMTLLNRQIKAALPAHLMRDGWVVAGQNAEIEPDSSVN